MVYKIVPLFFLNIMANETPVKYNSTTKKHEIFVSGDTIDPQFVGPTSPNGVAGGDLNGNYPNPTVDGIQGVPVSATAPTNGQVLTYNGASYVPTTPATGVSLATTTPVADTVTTGVIGVGTTAAHSDHAHPFTHSLALTQAGGLVYTHNGDTKSVPIPSGTIAQNIGFDTSGNPVRNLPVYARAQPTASQSVPNLTHVIFNIGNLISSSGITHTPASNSFTVLTAGFYMIFAQTHWQLNESYPSGSYVQHSLRINGVNDTALGSRNFITDTSGANSGPIINSSWGRFLNAGDTIQVTLWQGSGSTKNSHTASAVWAMTGVQVVAI